MSATLSERVEKVGGDRPLSEMGELQRREFHEALLDAAGFEDLPAKWQAAIMEADRRTGRRGWPIPLHVREQQRPDSPRREAVPGTFELHWYRPNSGNVRARCMRVGRPPLTLQGGVRLMPLRALHGPYP